MFSFVGCRCQHTEAMEKYKSGEKAEKTAEKKTEEYTEELLNFMAIQCEHH